MSSAPNQFPQSSKSTSSSQSWTESAKPAPEPSSPAETMTDQTANSILATPPTRMTSSDDAAPSQDAPDPVGTDSQPDEAASTQTPELQLDPDQPTEQATDALAEATSTRQQPIPPASEPMQYRAIGLVRGRYIPSEEQFTRGNLLTEDGVMIDSVLLGRVMSLVKKHINLEESHLWVVYPRTREKDLELHMQVVGVWEPEKLNRPLDASLDEEASEDEEAETEADETVETEAETSSQPTEAIEATSKAESIPASSSTEDLDDRYFSVRGEIVYQSEEEQRLLVKIRRSPKQGTTQAKAFKVALKGVIQGKALGYFWDLHVQRENNELVLKEANQIGMVPPQKRRGGPGGSAGGRRGGRPSGPPRRGGPGGGPSGPPRKRWQDREGGSSGQSRPARIERPTGPKQPISKPVKRRPPSEES